MPKISIIIPAYNAEDTIEETIQSVQQQTLKDFEVIVINDGSTDQTLNVLESIQDQRLKVFSYENSGVSAARNHGISLANSEFIAFLDADDLWTKDKLELQFNALNQHPEAGVAYSWTCFMNVDEYNKPSTFLPSPQYTFAGNVYKNLLISDFIHNGSNTLIRKQAIDSVGEFDETLRSCEDWDYWLRLAAKWSFVVVPKYQVLYRRTLGSGATSKVEVMKQAAFMAREKAFTAAPPRLHSVKKQGYSNFHLYFAGLYLQYRLDTDGLRQSQQHLLKAVFLYPKKLLDKTTQKLVIKLILRKFLPSKVANYIFNFSRKTITIPDPRLEL